MPSTLFTSQSGGMPLMSGAPFSGSPFQDRSVFMKVSNVKSGVLYVGLPNLSGTPMTQASGGLQTSGGLADGVELQAGDEFTIPPYRLVSGLDTPRLDGAAGASGMRVFWEVL